MSKTSIRNEFNHLTNKQKRILLKYDENTRQFKGYSNAKLAYLDFFDKEVKKKGYSMDEIKYCHNDKKELTDREREISAYIKRLRYKFICLYSYYKTHILEFGGDFMSTNKELSYDESREILINMDAEQNENNIVSTKSVNKTESEKTKPIKGKGRFDIDVNKAINCGTESKPKLKSDAKELLQKYALRVLGKDLAENRRNLLVGLGLNANNLSDYIGALKRNSLSMNYIVFNETAEDLDVCIVPKTKYEQIEELFISTSTIITKKQMGKILNESDKQLALSLVDEMYKLFTNN